MRKLADILPDMLAGASLGVILAALLLGWAMRGATL